MLDAVPVGWALAERHRIGVADDDAPVIGEDVGHFAPLHRLPPALEVLGVGRLELVLLDARVDATPDVMQINREHRRVEDGA